MNDQGEQAATAFLHPLCGPALALVVAILVILTTSFPPYIVIGVASALGLLSGIAIKLLLKPCPISPKLLPGPYFWALSLFGSVLVALWAEESANEGCQGVSDGLHRIGYTLGLALVGAVASWLPGNSLLCVIGRSQRKTCMVLTIVAVPWFAAWGYLWFILWRVGFGCVD